MLSGIGQRFAGRANLLGEPAHVVGVGEHFLDDVPGLGDAAGPGQRRDVPERAQAEGARAAGQSVPAVWLGRTRVSWLIPSRVARNGGSVGPANLTRGINSSDASRVSPPRRWT